MEDLETVRLLIPGPVTTQRATKMPMMRDWGCWDAEFLAVTKRVRDQLSAVANCGTSHVCIPLQGCGSIGVEASILSLVPKTAKILVPVNGTYSSRVSEICTRIGRTHVVMAVGEGLAPEAAAIDKALAADGDITHVAIVHCESSTGVLSPLDEIASVVHRHGRKLFVDAVSTFGAFDHNAQRLGYDILVATPNKCLEAMPGISFTIAKRQTVEAAKGTVASLGLDLHDQWQQMEANGQWRYTPPTQVVAALDVALKLLAQEGGTSNRLRRYERNRDVLVAEMSKLGFVTLIPPVRQAPIVISFRDPADPQFKFSDFGLGMRRRGYVIYPSRLTHIPTFRVACIGAIDETDIRNAVRAIDATMKEMGVVDYTPADA